MGEKHDETLKRGGGGEVCVYNLQKKQKLRFEATVN